MRCMRALVAWSAIVAAVFISGCEPKLFRAETVLEADGSVGRAIYQPTEATTDEAQQDGVWSGTTYAERIEPGAWPEKVSKLPKRASDEEHDYFAGWGEFDSPGEMPSAFVRKGPPGVPEGKLVVDYQREEHVLVVEHRWKETLTDIVTIDDMHLARRELADLLIPLAQKILEEALGEQYDTTLLMDWLHETARPWFFEITDVVFESGSREHVSEESFLLALAPVCARHGLKITDESGKPIEGEQFPPRFAAYAERVLRENLRRRDGEPVTDEAIREIFQWLDLENRPEGSERRFKRYDDAVEKVIAETFGGPEAFGDEVKPLLARMVGLYGLDFGAPYHFHYTLMTPGPIVKTNGRLLSDRKVRWKFAGGDAYPSGYAMQCESLVVQRELEDKLLGRKVLADRDEMVRYVDLVSSQDVVLEAMRACGNEGSMRPFFAAREQVAAGSEEGRAFDAMFKLLRLGEESAKR